MSFPQIAEIVERVANLDVDDPHEHAEIRDQLLELRELLDRISALDLAGCVDAAITITRNIAQVKPKAGEELRRILYRLLQVVEASMPASNAEELPASRFRKLGATPHDEGEEDDSAHGLRLINDMLLGEVLIQLGVCTQEKVDAALKIQRATNMRLGEAIVHVGAASWEEVDNALRLQGHLAQTGRLEARQEGRRGVPSHPPVSAFGDDHLNVLNDMMLGEEMVRTGVITREQLSKALAVQHAAGIRIGEALVETGAATWDQVAEGVRKQGRHRERGSGGEAGRGIAL